MIKRELYMKRIRPFIGTDLIKVMIGMRRSGKSVMLELIKEELVESGVSPAQFISVNFEDLNYAHEFDMGRDGIKYRHIRDFLLAEVWN